MLAMWAWIQIGLGWFLPSQAWMNIVPRPTRPSGNMPCVDKCPKAFILFLAPVHRLTLVAELTLDD